MRTEEEIRAHVRALKILQVKPCDCHLAGQPHSMQCVIGGRMMEVAVKSLEWALGSDEKAEFAAADFLRGK